MVYSTPNLMTADIMKSKFYTLMLVTNRQNKPIAQYLQWIKSCVNAGVTAVQLREKDQSQSSLLTFGQALKETLDRLEVPLIINDNIELAIKLNAAGVHLGQTDGDPNHARRCLGADKFIGVSIDSESQLETANDLPIDYVGIGAIFPTRNKLNVKTTWGLNGLKYLSQFSRHPIVGIGGINEQNAKRVILAGAHGLAVIAALHDANDAIKTTKQLRHIIDNQGIAHVK